MECSSKLCIDLVPKYKEFKSIPEKTFKGYKLVCKRNLNYYSIVSGMFRYKSGKIGPASYSGLYEKHKDFYQKELYNRLAICKTKEDAYNMLISYKDTHQSIELVVLEIEVSGDLQEALAYNSEVQDVEVVIGSTIGKIKEVEIDLS